MLLLAKLYQHVSILPCVFQGFKWSGRRRGGERTRVLPTSTLDFRLGNHVALHRIHAAIHPPHRKILKSMIRILNRILVHVPMRAMAQNARPGKGAADRARCQFSDDLLESPQVVYTCRPIGQAPSLGGRALKPTMPHVPLLNSHDSGISHFFKSVIFLTINRRMPCFQ